MGCTRGSPSYSGDGPHMGPNGLYNFQSPHSPTEGLLVLQSEENPSLLHVGCSVAQPSPILNDSLSQQGGCHMAWPTLKELLGGLSETTHEVLFVYTGVLAGYLNP